VEFLRPLKSSAALEQAHALLRAKCPSIEVDRYLAPDIEAATALVTGGALSAVFRALPGELPKLWIPK
jgi:histidine ammonia-lyase